MSTVIANMSMSLDGFIEDRDGGVGDVFAWTTAGPRTTRTPGREFRTAPTSADALRDAVETTGVIVCGRRLFDLTKGWRGHHPIGAPVVCVTHRPPADYPHDNATFVTTGVADAIAVAKDIAGERNVAVASADIARQCLDLGLLDAIRVDLVPVLLGAGRPFFAGVVEHVTLEDPEVTEGHGVTHLHYRVRKGAER
jgi:dihydrofolate reductase